MALIVKLRLCCNTYFIYNREPLPQSYFYFAIVAALLQVSWLKAKMFFKLNAK